RPRDSRAMFPLPRCTLPTALYTLSLHDALPICYSFNLDGTTIYLSMSVIFLAQAFNIHLPWESIFAIIGILFITSKGAAGVTGRDRKSTRLNSSHVKTSYAVFCLKKKRQNTRLD